MFWAMDFVIAQAGDSEVGNALCHVGRRLRAVGSEPLRRPVESTEKGFRCDGGVARKQGAPADTRRDQVPHPPLVAVTLGDNRAPQSSRQRIHFEMCSRPLNFRNQTEDVLDRQRVQAFGERTALGDGCV
jgi:hypothetical protein